MDGAMGTMIQMLHLDNPSEGRGVGGNLDMLNIVDPEGISRIHKSYIEAGAEIIATNTFSSTSVSQNEYGCSDKVSEINFRGARIALQAAEEEGLGFFKDGSSWKEVFSSTTRQDTYRVDLRGSSNRTKQVRVSRRKGDRKEFFHLNKVLVYGTKLY